MRTAIFAALVAGFAATPALALGPSYGLRIGAGPGFPTDEAKDDVDISSFSVGPALQVDLAVLAMEVNLLYTRVTSSGGGIEAISSDIDLPILATIGIPVVPAVLTAKLGAGIQPRFHLSSEVDGNEVKDEDDKTESMVMYIPINVGARIGAGLLSFGLDLRYLYQLTPTVKDDEERVHHLMFFGGLFF